MCKLVSRFFGMYSPSRAIRVAMYRKAGVRIGKTLEFGSNIWIDLNFKNMVTIGDNVILAGHDIILSHSFIMHGYQNEGFSPVVIGDGARIGVNCLILPGVIIGENSVIGAGAVVVEDIPPNCLAVGVPAKPIKYFKKSQEFEQKKPAIALRLYVKCKTCGIAYWSAITCSKKTFKSLGLKGNLHPCPKGHKNRYNQEDYFFKE